MRYLTKFCLISLIFTSLALTGCSRSDVETANIQAITAQDAAKLFEQDLAIIVDVREQDEWDAKHIPGAKHIPLGKLESRLSELEQYKTTPVILHCQSGVRSAKGSVVLKTAGFNKIYNMEGGILEWSKEGLVTE